MDMSVDKKSTRGYTIIRVDEEEHEFPVIKAWSIRQVEKKDFFLIYM